MVLRAGVVGAAGYAGIECVRVLLGHPGFEITYASSDGEAGHTLSSLYPALVPVTDMAFEELDISVIEERCDIVFLAVPHTASLALTPQLLERGITVIDLSADYRLTDPAVYEKWYGVPHTSPNLLAEAVYGLPELAADKLAALTSKREKLVACAGCYPTATALAAAPVLKAGLATSDRVISDCLSGVSGAGRKLASSSAFCNAHESATAYGLVTHRHTPEMAQTLTRVAGRDINVLFTPHLIPVKRGILATVYLDVSPRTELERIHDLYMSAYETSPFVSVLPLGTVPQIRSVVGTNNAQIGLALDPATGTLIAICAIDNLVKGAAGQAVQCANIVTGQAACEGLIRMYNPVV